MGIEVQQSPDRPHQYDCRVICDLCRSVQQVSTIMAEGTYETDEPDHVQREIRRRVQLEGWHWQEGGPIEGSSIRQVVTVTCRACQGAAMPSPLPLHLRELLRTNPSTLAGTLIRPAQNVIAALARNQHVPAAEDLHNLMGQAISRSHPEPFPDLRAAFNELGVLIRAQRDSGGPSWSPAGPLARLGDLTLPWNGSRPADFRTDGVRPGDTIVGNPGTPEEFRQGYLPRYRPDPEAFRQEVMGEFREAMEHNVFDPADVEAARERVSIPARDVIAVHTDPAVPRGQTYLVNQSGGYVVMAHPEDADGIREVVQQREADPDMQVFTSRPLTGFRSTTIPIGRGERARVNESTVVDRQGNRHTVGPFEVDLPDTPGPHRVGLDIATGGDITIASILVDGKVTGQIPIKRSTFMTEKLPPKSSWERLMEDDDDECP